MEDKQKYEERAAFVFNKMNEKTFKGSGVKWKFGWLT